MFALLPLTHWRFNWENRELEVMKDILLLKNAMVRVGRLSMRDVGTRWERSKRRLTRSVRDEFYIW